MKSASPARDAERVKVLTAEAGFERVGIASLSLVSEDFFARWLEAGFGAGMTYLSRGITARLSPSELLPGARCAVMVAVNYYQPANTPSPLSRGAGVPKIARYALGRDYHNLIGKRLKLLIKRLEVEFPEANFRAFVDSQPLLERELAHQAGLGWFGKNTMLIDAKRGSWFLLGGLLTDLDLEFENPSQGGCGTCTKCIEACPTGAIVEFEGRWAVDSRRCLSYWTIEHKGEIAREIQEASEGWVFGCDICQEVCPFNQPRPSQPLRAAITNEPDFLQHTPLATMTTEQLVSLGEEEWDRLSRGSPIRRAGFDGLKRNLGMSSKSQE